jgi:hypothetical protein
LIPSGRAEERKGRERQGQRSMALPSCSDSLRLSERSDAGAQRVPQRLTALSTAGHPQGADGRVAFFCLLFLATQEKKVRRRAHVPATTDF